MKNTYSRDFEKEARMLKVARITQYKRDTVKKVINDSRKNDLILSTYMALQEAEQEFENMLLEEVKKLVPFEITDRLSAL